MMTTQKIMRELRNNGQEMANKGSEMFDKAYQTYRDTFAQAKNEGPEFMTNLYKKGEKELTEVRHSIEDLLQEHMNKVTTLSKDVRDIYSEIRTKVVKEFPIDGKQYRNVLKEIELNLYTLPIPFFTKSRIPIADYDNLSVKKISDQLSTLSQDQLSMLLKYESKNLNRVTLKKELGKLINQN